MLLWYARHLAPLPWIPVKADAGAELPRAEGDALAPTAETDSRFARDPCQNFSWHSVVNTGLDKAPAIPRVTRDMHFLLFLVNSDCALK